MNSRPFTLLWLLVLPIICFSYIGLFATMWLWYPMGVEADLLRSHIVHFSIIYSIWLLVFFVYTLFDLATFRQVRVLVRRLIGAMTINAIVAISYFYFQPELLLTPRRFLLVHLLITGAGVLAWFIIVQSLLPRMWQRHLYIHQMLYDKGLAHEITELITNNPTLGWHLRGLFTSNAVTTHYKMTVVLPAMAQFEQFELQQLFAAKRQGVEFIEYHEFHEVTQRMVHLTDLNEAWFLRSVSYGRRRWYDVVKRIIDIFVAGIGAVLSLVLLPLVALLIKLDSPGPVFFVQSRVGQHNRVFRLFKLRTMYGGANNTWTTDNDLRITRIGKWLRRLRLDELPQLLNILKGDMSLVGPRPEQVHIAAQMAEQIPYYNERHSVKPGLTGWAQLHIYAASIEETKTKLQYDLYYVKHRSLWFDAEIVLRTVFHFITLQGK